MFFNFVKIINFSKKLLILVSVNEMTWQKKTPLMEMN